MKNIMPLDKNLNVIPVLPVNPAQDITDSTIPAGDSRIIRVSAVTDCRIWQYEDEKNGSGVLLPKGQTEYFAIYENYTVEITGTANIME